MITRRSALASLAGAAAASAQPAWIPLFDGASLNGWRANENPATWSVDGATLRAAGPRSHLYYTGSVQNGAFKNFEFETEVFTEPLANSGIFFHTKHQDSGWPAQGFEVQVNNTAKGEGAYVERKKTGSLYGVRNQYKTLVRDREWFRLNILVRGNNVQVRINRALTVDYTEPAPPLVTRAEPGRVLSQGAFALQGHDPGSVTRYRNIRVRPLPDNASNPDARPSPNDAHAQAMLELGAQNYPLIDAHGHMKRGLTLDMLLANSRLHGLGYGLAINAGPVNEARTDADLRKYVESLRGQPVFCALQAEGREWVKMFSREAVALFDYAFSDSMTWTDNRGRRMRLFVPAEVGAVSDTAEFMDTFVARTLTMFEREPIDIWANPAYLPDVLVSRFDELWTDERIRKVVQAAKAHRIAIELNNRYRLPGDRFIAAARAEGCTFSFGTNNNGPDDLGRCEYSVEMVRKHRIPNSAMFNPPQAGDRAIDRKSLG